MGKRVLAVGLLALLAVGCGHAKKDVGVSGGSSKDSEASKDGASSKDSDPSRSKDSDAPKSGASDRSYHKLVVFARFSDPASRSAAERAFVKRLHDKGVEGVAASTLLPLGDTVPNAEIDRAVRRSGVEGVVLVSMADQKPAAASRRSQTGTRTGPIVYASRDQRAGSYYLSLPVVYYDVQLIDVATGKESWMHDGRSGANTYAKFDDLIGSVASKSVDSMRKAHQLQKAEKAESATRPRRVNPH